MGALGRHAEPHSYRPSVAGYDGFDSGHPPASGAFGPRPHMYNARFRRTPYSASGFVVPLPLSRSMTAANDQVAPLGRSRRVGRRQRGRHLLAGDVRAIAGRARLLPPRVRERPRVEGVEPGVLDERHSHLAIRLAIGRDGDRDAVRAPRGLSLPRERVGTDRVPCLDDRPAQLFGHPQALHLTGFDGVDPAVTLRIVVRGVDDDRLGWHARRSAARPRECGSAGSRGSRRRRPPRLPPP